MATGTEQAEKAFRSAEERFLAGDLAGALLLARKAKRNSAAPLPALQNAHTAYEVHAAAAAIGGSNCWYAVLGISTGGCGQVTVTHDAIKKRYRRLCLVLHPDKNRSAAADGAFKLLQRAWEALSVRHPPDPEPAVGTEPTPTPKPKPTPTPTPTPKPRPPPPPTQEPEPDWWSSYFRYKPPPDRTWSSYGYTPPPPPFSSRPSSDNFDGWRSANKRNKGTTNCGHCGSEFESAAAAAGGHRSSRSGSGSGGGRCHACGTPLDRPPPHTAPPPAAAGTASAADAEPPRDGERFRCPTECCRCGMRFSSMVSTGMCKLRCRACSYDAFVYVYSRHRAKALLFYSPPSSSSCCISLRCCKEYETVHVCVPLCRYGGAGRRRIDEQRPRLIHPSIVLLAASCNCMEQAKLFLDEFATL